MLHMEVAAAFPLDWLHQPTIPYVGVLLIGTGIACNYDEAAHRERRQKASAPMAKKLSCCHWFGHINHQFQRSTSPSTCHLTVAVAFPL